MLRFVTIMRCKIMKEPVKPSKEDCCNSGCNPCIFDVYEKQLSLYKKLRNHKDLPVQADNGISQLEYTSFFIFNTTVVCDSHKLISFKRLGTEDKSTPRVWWNPGDHFLLKFSTDTKSCSRAYTPIKLKLNFGEKYDFSIILKHCNSGLVSKYLFDLIEGEKTQWRGPYGSFSIVPNKYKRIIMLAHGTGIAPLLSIIDSILDNEDDMTNIILFYCCPSEDFILFRNELYNYQSFWNFTYKIFLNSLKASGKYKYQEPVNNRKFKYEELMVLKPFTNDDQCLLCGSTSFMEEYSSCLLKDGISNKNIIKF